MTYFDSSALVKRYLDERGSDRVKEVIEGDSQVVTSKLAYPEMLSAFSRKWRDGDIPDGTFSRVVDDFEADWGYFLVVEFKDELFKVIKKLLKSHRLRGADCVHLASALWLRQASGGKIVFVASDANLLKAATAEKLDTISV